MLIISIRRPFIMQITPEWCSVLLKPFQSFLCFILANDAASPLTLMDGALLKPTWSPKSWTVNSVAVWLTTALSKLGQMMWLWLGMDGSDSRVYIRSDFGQNVRIEHKKTPTMIPISWLNLTLRDMMWTGKLSPWYWLISVSADTPKLQYDHIVVP